MLLAKTLSFYKRREVQKMLVEQAQNKEVAVRFTDFFGKRPDVLVYENDVLDFAKKKATSFHCSEELWRNPLNLGLEMKKQDIDNLRTGWDLILDIDCHHFIYSKMAAHILIKILKDQGINSVTCKFSGNKGFHLAVPFEAFPDQVNNTPIKDLFPDAPRRIAFYLRDKLKPLLEVAILKIEKNDINNVSKRTGLELQKLMIQKNLSESGTTFNSKDIFATNEITLNVDAFLEIDTILIAPRHLYRMPYSFHEKSMLVSVPVDINKILKFEKSMAEPELVKFDIPFLDRSKAVKGEAQKLIINAFDFFPKNTEEKREHKEFILPEEAIPEEYFPPCIKLIFNGLEDGKKRALFTIINFLRGSGWSLDAIEQRIYDWNKKNPEPLREVYLKGQLHQLKKTKDILPPHNCKSYYQDLQVCQPDTFCSKIKNPLQYSKSKYDINKVKQKTARPRLTEEQKEMRRTYRAKLKEEKDKSAS